MSSMTNKEATAKIAELIKAAERAIEVAKIIANDYDIYLNLESIGEAIQYDEWEDSWSDSNC